MTDKRAFKLLKQLSDIPSAKYTTLLTITEDGVSVQVYHIAEVADTVSLVEDFQFTGSANIELDKLEEHIMLYPTFIITGALTDELVKDIEVYVKCIEICMVRDNLASYNAANLFNSELIDEIETFYISTKSIFNAK